MDDVFDQSTQNSDVSTEHDSATKCSLIVDQDGDIVCSSANIRAFFPDSGDDDVVNIINMAPEKLKHELLRILTDANERAKSNSHAADCHFLTLRHDRPDVWLNIRPMNEPGTSKSMFLVELDEVSIEDPRDKVKSELLASNSIEPKPGFIEDDSPLRIVMDNMLGFVAMLDVDGNLLEANRTALLAGGVQRDDVVGKKFWNCCWWNFNPESKTRIENAVIRASKGEIIRYDAITRLAGDARATFDFMLSPVRNAEGRVIYLVPSGVNITRRKAAEERLAYSTDRLSLAMAAAGMGAFEWNPLTDEAFWDEQHRKMTGFPQHVKLGSTFLDMIHPDDIEENRALIENALTTMGDYIGEFRFCRADGNIRWFAARAKVVPGDDGESVRLIGLNWDITEQKQTLTRLRMGEERLRLAAEAAGFGSYQVDLEKGESIWSRELMNLIGLGSNTDVKVFSDKVPKFVHPDDRADVAKYFADVADAKGPAVHDFTHRIVLPTRETRWVRLQGKTIFSESSGRPIKIIGTLLDITQQKRIEQSLNDARRIAESASDAKSEFLANMSHEIRTPMSAIMGYTDILSRQLTDPDDLKCASIIRHNGKFLLEIINDILDISKIEAGKLELSKKRFRPEQLVADVLALMEIRAAEKGITLEIVYKSELPKTIRSDAKRLKQILVNLIGNAIKFTDSGSVKLIVKHLYSDCAPRLHFEVIDTGIGMKPQEQEQLFQPFTQADSSLVREFGGTGLGLTISQRLARMLGGEIKVESVQGVGSKFSFAVDTGSLRNVPMIVPQLTAPRASLPASPKKLPRLNCRVLVVDDRRDIQFIAQHFIQDAGGTVVTAENGLVAIKKVKQAEKAGQPFDLITMDMQMPVMDGYEATRKLRSSGFSKPIIAITAHAMEGDRKTCLDAGCSDYLPKPIDGPKFVTLLAGNLVAEKPGSAPACRVLVIDDAKDASGSLKQLLEFDGHDVKVAYDGKTGIEMALKFLPQVVLLDLGLPDMHGFDVLKQLKAPGTLSDTMFVAATGRDCNKETAAAGFDHHLIKPLAFSQLEQLIANKLAAKKVVKDRLDFPQLH